MTKREIAFVLSLSATITSPTFLWLFFSLWWKLESVVTFGLIGLVILIMTAGLLFMRISKTERGRIIGGTIILIMGIIAGILAFLTMGEEFRVILSILAVMATIGGYLGIQGAREDEVGKRQYPKKFISGVSIMGFTFALVLVFVFFFLLIILPIVVRDEFTSAAIFYLIVPPLWIMSIIFNTISTVIVKREEIIPKRTKILIMVSWCLIALPGLLLLLFVLPALR